VLEPCDLECRGGQRWGGKKLFYIIRSWVRIVDFACLSSNLGGFTHSHRGRIVNLPEIKVRFLLGRPKQTLEPYGLLQFLLTEAKCLFSTLNLQVSDR
jgi:hypothetical protein